ncbi:MAG: hypothetical protein JXR12_05820 [Neptunomonas phycophila]|uniref:hypothetical protein n=1 Tax=Neptunomonas phycophila TaxID=1572645 RepID=UPI003B8E9348
MLSEISILDIIDAAEPTDVAGLLSTGDVTDLTVGSSIEAGYGVGCVSARSIVADVTSNINVDQADIEKARLGSVTVDQDLMVNGMIDGVSLYLTGDMNVSGCATFNGYTSFNGAMATTLQVTCMLDAQDMRIQNRLSVEAYGDIRYNRNYEDRSMIDDIIQVRNDVDSLMGNPNNDIYNHPAVVGLQCEIAQLNSTVAALRQMLP